MAASLKYYKDQIESALADAQADGYGLDAQTDCCGCSGIFLEIWEMGNYSDTVQRIDLNG